MKLLKSFSIMFCIALLIGTASAETANEDLPTQAEVTAFLDSIPHSSGYVEAVYNAVISDHPTWKCDTWSSDAGKAISVYYTDPSSKKGYGSIYCDDTGNKIGIMCGVTYKLEDSYLGEKQESTTEEEDIEEEIEEEEEEEEEEEDSEQDYSDLMSFLDNDGTNTEKFTKSKACASALISALEEDGWNAELVKVTYKTNDKKYTRYVAGVETDDEGTVYIDSFGGIDKRVTQLEKGEQWLAESACGTCPHDSEGKYNRGIVIKITYP